MKKNDVLKELEKWQGIQKALDAQLDLFYDLTRAQPDSDLLAAIYAVADAHTYAVGQIISDEMHWLDWWRDDCEFGERCLSAANPGGKPRPIKTLKHLAALIAR